VYKEMQKRDSLIIVQNEEAVTIIPEKGNEINNKE
jgi:hypothetical protein